MPLNKVLRSLIDYSRRSGMPAKQRLGHGLTLGILVKEDTARVQLARADVFPSTDEWKTVIAHWPGQVTVLVGPAAVKDASTYYLLGKVKLEPVLL